MIFFYKITNLLNNKVYIGQSVREKERWRQHKYFSKNPTITGQYIHQAMNKYGIGNFEYEVIASCKKQEDADMIETLLIEQYKSRDKQFGYNLAVGGSSGWNKGLPKEQQPMFGKKQSKETRKKISESNIGKNNPHTDEWNQKISNSILGKTHSLETKIKMSESHLGKTFSNETKIKMSRAKLGTFHSEDTKKKMSLQRTGKLTGANNPNSKLTMEQAVQIRDEYNKLNTSCKILAEKYGVRRQTIYNIISGKSYG